MKTQKFTRRQAVAAISGSVLALHAHAQERYPNRVLNMVVPFAAGNVTDTIARMVGERLATSLGQPVVIENKPGGSGGVGMAALGRAAPDGYTFGMSSIGPMSLNPALYAKLPYDPAKGFNILSVVFRGPILILVDSSSPFKSLQDLVRAAQQQPLDYASPGTGSSQHLTGELFARVTKSRLMHVPNRGSGQAATLLLGKHVPVLFEVTSVGVPFIKQGQMRALAITSGQRHPALPDVPTVKESGFPDFATEGWLALVAPAGIPDTVRDRLAAETRKVMAMPDVRAFITAQGGFPEAMTPEQSTAYVQSETARWGELIRSAGIKLD